MKKDKGSKHTTSGSSKPASGGGLNPFTQKHLRIGWVSLLVFLTLGIVLETLHGFKVGYYLDVPNQTRRFMWTLAHAHGTLLGLVNLAFAFTCHALLAWAPKDRSFASICLLGATILMPMGFFLGGIVIYGGDPGIGIFLLPVGAIMLLMAVFKTAMAVKRH